MSDFRRLSDSVLASPQLSLDDVAEAKALGVKMIVNNRPDGEEPDQLPGAAIQQAATDAGIDYVPIPVGQAGFGDAQITAMAGAFLQADGPVLAYCRSGTRSTFLWSLAQASQGDDPERLVTAAAKAGYDVSPVRHMLDALSQANK